MFYLRQATFAPPSTHACVGPFLSFLLRRLHFSCDVVQEKVERQLERQEMEDNKAAILQSQERVRVRDRMLAMRRSKSKPPKTKKK